jgi:hypothetical protein
MFLYGKKMFLKFRLLLKEKWHNTTLVVREINEEVLGILLSKNKELFNEFSIIYLEWCYNQSFNLTIVM